MAMFFSNFLETAAGVLIGLGTVTFLWESGEFLIAKIPTVAKYTKRKFHTRDITPKGLDTVFDVLLNFAGATMFLYFIK